MLRPRQGNWRLKCAAVQDRALKLYPDVRIDFYRKTPSKPLQNTLFYALVSIICGGKPLITTNKLAGPVGKKGVNLLATNLPLTNLTKHLT